MLREAIELLCLVLCLCPPTLSRQQYLLSVLFFRGGSDQAGGEPLRPTLSRGGLALWGTFSTFSSLDSPTRSLRTCPEGVHFQHSPNDKGARRRTGSRQRW